MSRTRISKTLRDRISPKAGYRCGYCLSAESVVGTPMEIDHVIPESLGGSSEKQNLSLACSMCNDHKSNPITALDH